MLTVIQNSSKYIFDFSLDNKNSFVRAVTIKTASCRGDSFMLRRKSPAATVAARDLRFTQHRPDVQCKTVEKSL